MGWIALEWLATVLAMLGAVLVARKNGFVWPVWLMANTLWLVLAVCWEKHGLAVLMIFYICTCLYGMWQWRQTQ